MLLAAGDGAGDDVADVVAVAALDAWSSDRKTFRVVWNEKILFKHSIENMMK